ncbi:MAG: hypothetical protein RL488_270 [Actinomycetota bacterium]
MKLSDSDGRVHNQDMDNEFENDPLLSEVKRSSKRSKSPALDVDLLFEATRKKPRRYKLPVGIALVGSVSAIGLFLFTPLQNLIVSKPSLMIASGDSIIELAQRDAVVAYGDGDTVQGPRLNYSFSASDNLESVGQTSDAYLLGPGKTPKEILATLKNYFNIAGEPRQVTDSYTNGQPNLDPELRNNLRIGDELKSAGAFPYGESGAVGFIYSDASAASNGTGQVPSKFAATHEVVKLSAMLGLKVNPDEVHFVLESKNYLAAVVKLTVNGQLSPVNWVFAWRDGGKITELSGVSTTFEPQGQPKTIDPSEAIARAGRNEWSTEAIGENPNDWYQLLQDGLPVPKGKTDPKTKIPVVITKTESGLGIATASNGAIWLLPSYLLYTTDGFAVSVIAVEDFQKR